jgi:hypothetical protein
VNVAVRAAEAPVPVIFSGYDPAVAVADTVTDSVALPPEVTDDGLTAALTPAGAPETDNRTG